MLNQTIKAKNRSAVSISARMTATLKNWFSPEDKPKIVTHEDNPKIIQPGEFLKTNNFKHFRQKTIRPGEIELTVFDRSGNHFTAKGKNFLEAYPVLVSNFNNLKKSI